jgi:biopolymer transport protein ExbD
MARHMLRHHKQARHETELNLVPLIDIFTVLVFFLLITAVFSRTTILGLHLPERSSTETPPDHLPRIEVVMRRGGIEAGDRANGPMQTLANRNQGYDLQGLSVLLQQLKARYPDNRAATILLEPDISYDQLVQVMDAMRTTTASTNASAPRAELFPDISIGDAPATPVAALGQGN